MILQRINYYSTGITFIALAQLVIGLIFAFMSYQVHLIVSAHRRTENELEKLDRLNYIVDENENVTITKTTDHNLIAVNIWTLVDFSLFHLGILMTVFSGVFALLAVILVQENRRKILPVAIAVTYVSVILHLCYCIFSCFLRYPWIHDCLLLWPILLVAFIQTIFAIGLNKFKQLNDI